MVSIRAALCVVSSASVIGHLLDAFSFRRHWDIDCIPRIISLRVAMFTSRLAALLLSIVWIWPFLRLATNPPFSSSLRKSFQASSASDSVNFNKIGSRQQDLQPCQNTIFLDNQLLVSAMRSEKTVGSSKIGVKRQHTERIDTAQNGRHKVTGGGLKQIHGSYRLRFQLALVAWINMRRSWHQTAHRHLLFLPKATCILLAWQFLK